MCDQLIATRPYDDDSPMYRGKFFVGTQTTTKRNSSTKNPKQARNKALKCDHVFEVENPNEPGTKIKYELCQNHLNKGPGAFCGLHPVKIRAPNSNC